MAKTPAEVLRKTKAADKKNDAKDDKKGDEKPAAKRSALIDFIAKHKK